MTVQELWEGVMSYLPVASSLASVGVGFGMLWLKQHFAPREAVSALGERLDELENDMASVQFQLRCMPTASDIEGLRLGIKEVQGEQQALGAKLDGLYMLIQTMQTDSQIIKEHLMDGAR